MGLDRPVDINAEQRKTVLVLLAKHLPNTTAWVYGSRVKWTSSPKSDLDLVVFATPEQAGQVSDLREAFEESNLPFRVDLFVWDDVPEQFRKTIEAEHVVLVEREELGVASGWRKATLDQLGRIVTGKTPPSKIQGFFGGDIPFVTPTDLDGRRVIVSTGRSLTRRGVEAVYNSRIPARSVMVSCIGSDMGKTAIAARECVTNQQINSIVVDSRDEPLFVYYNLSNRKVEIRASAGGSAQPILNKSGFGQFDILLPPLPEQRTIAHILGTLDDKIELNRQMNQTLEEMARALFKSWFVDFDPVRAKATLKHHAAPLPQGGSDWSVERARASLDSMDPNIAALFPDSFVDSELGAIPAGWEVKRIEDIAERVAMGPFGSSIKVSTFVDEGIPVISGQHLNGMLLNDNEFRFITEEHAKKLAKANVQRGDVIFTHAGSIGQVACIPETSQFERYVISQRQFYMRCDVSQISPLFVVHFFKTSKGRHQLLANTSSTGVPSISRPVTYLRSIRLCTPPNALWYRFNEIVGGLHLKAGWNTTESRSVAAVRDALLLKLVSGELRVGVGHDFVGDVMTSMNLPLKQDG